MPRRGEALAGIQHEAVMQRWARVATLTVVVCLISACTARLEPSAVPSAPLPTPGPSAQPLGTPAPCSSPLALLAGFSERISAQLAALQTLLSAPTFDNGQVIATVRAISTTLTTFKGLEATLRPCEGSFQLAERLAKVRTAAETAITAAVSADITSTPRQRDAAAKLVSLLPDIATISKDAKALTNGLGLGVDLSVANAYSASASATYGTDLRRSVQALLAIDCSGLTSGECGPLADTGANWVNLATRSLERHLAFMKEHAAASCFSDAYAADTEIANNLISVLSTWSAGTAAGMRPENDKIEAGFAAAQDFLSRFDSYFIDCK